MASYISSPKAPDPPFSLQNGTGTGMMITASINVSAFMVLPEFLPPTSATFFLVAASHIRPSFQLNNVTGILIDFTGSFTGNYFDDFPKL